MSYDELIEQQLKIEKEAHQYSYDRLTREIAKRIDKGQANELKEGQIILLHAIDLVAKKIEDVFAQKYQGSIGKAIEYLRAEFKDKPKDLAYIAIVTIVRSISKETYIPTTSLIKQLMQQIKHSILLYDLEKQEPNYNSYIEKKYRHKGKPEVVKKKIKIKQARESILASYGITSSGTLIGSIVIDIVIKSGANIIESKAINTRNKRVNHIVYTKECFRMVLQSREQLLLDYRKFPIFIAPPVDWKGFDGSGGYYNKELYKVPIVKTKGTKKLVREYFDKYPSEKLYTVLNTLQQTPWRVNKRVLDIMDRIYEDNIVDEASSSNNPYLVGKLPYNGYLEAEDFVSPNSYGEIHLDGKYKGLPKDKKNMLQYFDDVVKQEKILSSSNGKTIMTKLVLHNAKEYRNYDKIYFSYQYDFRGRIYPIQQHLQPQGSSEIKALLEFANGYPITNEEELKWFLIHGANCYGFDKEEYEVRIEKIKEKHEEILQVAEAPLRYRHYWKDCDEPYLYLAWCFEYADYHTLGSDFKSHIPIALDATCSGIQIYSGLLLDGEGAEAVNVVGTTRNDIYQRVANRVNDYLVKGDYPSMLSYTTADNVKHEISTRAIADSVKGKVTRKLTKRNTMTQPYSVTKFGMYEQLKSELLEIENNGGKFWIGDTWLLAKLLTELNDRAIVETVKGARIGQDFLKEVTKDLVKHGKFVAYTTPILKFPVIQKIQQTKISRVTTPVGRLITRKTLNKLHEQKMVNGIAPNYIHSLDALLLSLTILKLIQDGCKDFHLIHDSYGVPISQVANLNKRVREAYIEIFSSRPLGQWLNQVYKGYPKQADDVMINTLDLDDVSNSRYIFS